MKVTPQEQQLLNRFLEDFKNIPTPPIDAQADQLIRSALGGRNDGLYLLVQHSLVQRMALQEAQTRIDQLQRELQQSRTTMPAATGNSFLPNTTSQKAWAASPQEINPSQAQGSVPPPSAYAMPRNAGGVSSFLQSAATTAAGVAGGALLFQGIESLLGAHHSSGGGWNTGWDGTPNDVTEHNVIINEYVNDRNTTNGWQADSNDGDPDFDNFDNSGDDNNDETWV